MEIVLLKSLINRYLKLSFALLGFFLLSDAQAQSWVPYGNGSYGFYSMQPNANLSFWLFGDGYHSFKSTLKHDYSSPNMIAKHYSVKPYEPEDVEEMVLPPTNEGTNTPNISYAELDNKISLKRSWNLVEDEENYFILMFENVESSSAINGCVEFHYNDENSDISFSDVLDYPANNWVYDGSQNISEYQDFTHKFKWYFDNLAPGEQRFVYIPAGCLAGPVAKVKTRAVMKVDNSPAIDECELVYNSGKQFDGANPQIDTANVYTLISIVSNDPYDPNCIEATPNGLFDCNVYQKVRYKVTFQNEGVDAVGVATVDLETPQLFQSVNIISASHSCYLDWSSNNITVVFEDIHLTGLGQTPPPIYDETIGFVEFDVCYYPPHLDSVEIIGSILFDQEDKIPFGNTLYKSINCWTGMNSLYPREPLASPDYTYSCTMSASHQDYEPNSLNDRNRNEKTGQIDDVEIYPNPVTDIVNLYKLSGIENGMVSILTAEGRLIQRISISNQGFLSIDVSSFEKGLYLLIIDSETKNNTHKFVKI